MALSKSPIQTLFPPFTFLSPYNRLSVYYITMGFTDDALRRAFVLFEGSVSLSVAPKPQKP